MLKGGLTKTSENVFTLVKGLSTMEKWTGQVDWTSGFTEIFCKLVTRHEFQKYRLEYSRD